MTATITLAFLHHAAAFLVVAGLLRVFHAEKGAAYYFARRKVRLLIHVELTPLFIIMLMAVMMARGIWYLR